MMMTSSALSKPKHVLIFFLFVWSGDFDCLNLNNGTGFPGRYKEKFRHFIRTWTFLDISIRGKF